MPDYDALFWAKVDRSGECWLWTGSRTTNGYGQASHPAYPTRAAHRVAYLLDSGTGEIPIGLDVCHRCDVKLCVRPQHLFVGTRSENMQDASRKGRLAGLRRRPRVYSRRPDADLSPTALRKRRWADRKRGVAS